jgi:DNA polymerase-3 subunit beta
VKRLLPQDRTIRLPTMPVDDYPQLPPLPATAGRIPATDFAQAVAQVVVAAGRDDTLPVLTGVRVEFDGDKLTLLATDRYRLAMKELAWTPEASDLPAAALVPARNISEAARALAGGPEVTLALAGGSAGDSLMGFAGAGRTTTTRLLDGEYPRVRSLMPASHEAEATVSTAALTDAVKRVSLVAQRTSPVRLSFSAGELLLEAGTGEDAQASEVLEITYSGEPLTIAFNPQFLLDGLGVLDDSQAMLTFTDPKRPAVMSGAESAGYSYLLMPVRLSS